MDKKLVDLFTEQLRIEKENNYELLKQKEKYFLFIKESDKSQISVSEYNDAKLLLEMYTNEKEKSDIKIDTWDKAREIAIGYNGGK